MLLECLCILALAAEPKPRPELPKRVHVSTQTWNDTGDTGIPAWTPTAGGGQIVFRPETRRAYLGRCGARARALARFIYWHEFAHAVRGTYDEGAANAYAYARVPRRVERLLPAYGQLLASWRVLRIQCLTG